MSYEKKTDHIIAQLLHDVKIKLTPNDSDVKEIGVALSTSSKRGKGKNFPEFTALWRIV